MENFLKLPEVGTFTPKGCFDYISVEIPKVFKLSMWKTKQNFLFSKTWHKPSESYTIPGVFSIMS